VLPSLTDLDLMFPDSAIGSNLFSTLCSVLQSARGPALEAMVLRRPNFGAGAGAQFESAIRLRLAHSLRMLSLRDWIGTDADGAEVMRFELRRPPGTSVQYGL
jgi:hypothetical protein